eukprot:4209977-Amphidinium_carterae.1
MSPSAIITLAAEVQLLAAQLSEKSEIRLHVLQTARALIAAHECLCAVSIAREEQPASLPSKRAAPSEASSSSSDDSSSSSSSSTSTSTSRISNVDPDHLAQEAIQNGDYSMQMTADIIERLPLPQRRVGISGASQWANNTFGGGLMQLRTGHTRMFF